MNASWIWKSQQSSLDYNQSIIARKNFTLSQAAAGVMRITADSFYRLYINGEWIGDGPCRSWPEHYQFDVHDVTGSLREGENEIRVLARYWGTGTFHTVPRQAGLLAELEVTLPDGETMTIATGETWEAAEAPAFRRDTPKISIQMEPQELYDARLEHQLAFAPAASLYAAGEGPWKDLSERDSALLSRQPVAFKAFRSANRVRRSRDLHFCLMPALLNNPGLVEANGAVSQFGGAASLMILDQPAEITVKEWGMQVFVGGQRADGGVYALPAGEHLVLALVTGVLGHQKEKMFRIVNPPEGLRFASPLGSEHPWCWVAFPEFNYADDDLRWSWFGPHPERKPLIDGYFELLDRLSREVRDRASFEALLKDRAVCLPSEDLFVQDYHWLFMEREADGSADACVVDPLALMHDNSAVTTILPCGDDDIELCYDLGEQNVGYYDLDLSAPAGTVVDIYGVEYINAQGIIQHTDGNRNGMRLITREGTNRFLSTKRRAGRYIFITLRNLSGPVKIRKLQLVESTYPVNAVGSFTCSDARLEQIWEISARTLKLCMEDSFTDCPLYEQTLWVGDARNESVYAYPVYGAVDLGRRCIRLAAQSLERYPITGCQVPSSWDCLLPAWSFLWGISVWDYYTFTADRAFLAEIWPAVVQNLRGAEGLLDENGLFSGKFWNMFDWSGIDDQHETVLHNSLLLVGAIDAAQKCAEVLAEHSAAEWLASFRARLAEAINCWWDDSRGAYPDSLLADGSASPSSSQHTSFLALLYDVIRPENREAALSNLLTPPDAMVKVGSPFAMMYAYEALEKEGRAAEIIQSIYGAYLPMLEDGATTVWEVFPTSKDRPGGFPTRSHCHAWSAAPLYFLNRLVLGLRPAGVGGEAYEISPRITGLEWASGSAASAKGPVHVSWRRGGGSLRVKVSAPEGVAVRYVENETTLGLTVMME